LAKGNGGPGALLVYGAAGYIGELTVRAAVARGLRPVIAGREPTRLAALGAEFGLDHRAVELTDAEALDRSLHGVSVILNAAGPFTRTWQPIVDACLRRRVHYLDLTGEVAVFEAIRSRGLEARRRGIVLLPGVGFDVVPSDCLAAHVAAQLPGAQVLRIAVSGLELVSRGSARTLVEQAALPTFVRRNGRLQTVLAGSLERSFDYGSGPSPSVAVNWGDLATAFDTTGIANIETYFEATPLVRSVVGATRMVGPLLSAPPLQTLMTTFASTLPPGPGAAARATRSAVIVAEADDSSGRTVRSRLRTPEAYTLSARTAAAVASEVMAGNYVPGFQTPARLYGADYILEFEGVTREALESHP
jgi:short subunit dehydrogenase-like uncharacterized protein